MKSYTCINLQLVRYEIYHTQINKCDWLLFIHHGTRLWFTQLFLYSSVNEDPLLTETLFPDLVSMCSCRHNVLIHNCQLSAPFPMASFTANELDLFTQMQ